MSRLQWNEFAKNDKVTLFFVIHDATSLVFVLGGGKAEEGFQDILIHFGPKVGAAPPSPL